MTTKKQQALEKARAHYDAAKKEADGSLYPNVSAIVRAWLDYQIALGEVAQEKDGKK